MNIAYTDEFLKIVVKTCGRKQEKDKKVTYSFIDKLSR
jgi:hypothetical protein